MLLRYANFNNIQIKLMKHMLPCDIYLHHNCKVIDLLKIVKKLGHFMCP